MDKITLSRRQLYDLIWSEPLLTLSLKYNISDVGLRKMCIRLDLPLPEIGYWNKVKAGKKVTVKPFKDNFDVDQNITLGLRDQSLSEDEIGISPELALQRKIEADKLLDLIVPDELTDPEPSILALRKTFSKLPKDYREGDLLYSGSGELDVRVSPGQVPRALRLLNAVIKVMRQRGHQFVTEHGHHYLIMWRSRYELSLREGYTVIADAEHSWRRSTYVPTGLFTIQFEHWGKTTMKDGQKTIEQQLAKLIARLEIKSIEERRWREESDRQNAIREEEERRRQMIAERKKEELESFRTVIKNAQRWQASEMVRSYILQVENQAGDSTPELAAWLDWVKKKADWFDPFVAAEDEWLEDVDPNSLLTAKKTKPSPDDYEMANGNDSRPVARGWPLLPWYLKQKL